MLKAILAALFLFSLALGAPASRSSEPTHSARLFQAETSDGAWNAGLEIILSEGWKTYWRVPGDSGVPPQFDWSGSVNLRAVTVGWPAPRRYRDAAGETIGYLGHIVFPLRIDRLDPSTPIEVKLSLFYAVCKDVCIPAEKKLSLELAAASTAALPDRELLATFAAQIPGSATASFIPAVKSLRMRGSDKSPILEIALAAPVPSATTDMFIEGHRGAYFRKPRPVQAGASSSLFHLPVDGIAAPAVLRGKQLTVTLVSGRSSLAQTLPVD
jgi:DsbC/DsbD-like thiol-disulfide interchange protein